MEEFDFYNDNEIVKRYDLRKGTRLPQASNKKDFREKSPNRSDMDVEENIGDSPILTKSEILDFSEGTDSTNEYRT